MSVGKHAYDLRKSNPATEPARFVVVAQPDDLLADRISRLLPDLGTATFRCAPSALGDVTLSIADGQCLLNGGEVRGILFHCLPSDNFAHGYEPDEQSFCTSELSSAWLAALNLPSVFAVNQYDADMWYDDLRWMVWRRVLQHAGISVSPMMIGKPEARGAPVRWLPYTVSGTQEPYEGMTHAVLASALIPARKAGTSLVVCGEAIAGEQSEVIVATAALLLKLNIRIAEITFDDAGSVLRINPRPLIRDAAIAEAAAFRLVEAYHDHLHHW